MGTPQDEIERIVIRLDQSEPIERAIFERYQQKSRSRRQEWIREVLEAGFVALGLATDAAIKPASRLNHGGAVTAAAAPPASAHASLEVSAPAVVDAGVMGAGLVAAAPIAPTPVPAPAPAAGRQSTSVLKGFLPSASPTPNRGTPT